MLQVFPMSGICQFKKFCSWQN